MVIKILGKNGKQKIRYRSGDKILMTSKDLAEADRLDDFLNLKLRKLTSFLKKKEYVNATGKKNDTLKVWYIIGQKINQFLKNANLKATEEIFFWGDLYNRLPALHKGGTPTDKQRNDYRTASLLAKYPFKMIKKGGTWALWRELLTYRIFLTDKRIIDWIVKRLSFKPMTRNDARPFLRKVARRFQKVDTTILSDIELHKKLEEIN